MRRLRTRVFAAITVLVAMALAAVVGALSPAVAIPAEPGLVTYAYDANHDSPTTTSATTVRGPPAAYDHTTAYNAVDLGLHGSLVLARSDGFAPSATYDYDQPEPLVSAASVASTTEVSTRVDPAGMSTLEPGRVAAKAAGASDHIVLGLRAHGLEDAATKAGGRTLLNDPDWMASLNRAIADPSTRFTVSLDGMSGASTYSQVMGAAQRGASAGTRGWATDWEMPQLLQGGRLPDVTFMRGGTIVENPWAVP